MRPTVALLAGALSLSTALSASLGVSVDTAPTAHADGPSPLYDLVDAAAQRLQTADPVAAFKWVNGGSIEDPVRVQQVLNTVSADAVAHGIDPNTVRTAFTDQVHATEGVEYTRFGQWKLDPAAAPTAAPDLSASRAAIDELNRTIVTEMARQWDSLRSPDCVRDVDDAVRAVAVNHQLDALYVQGLVFATRSYCT